MDEVETIHDERATARTHDDTTQHLAVVVFAAVAVTAFLLALVVGHDQWFIYDEWDFLAQRTGGNLGDLFRPHAQHWVTLPILTYRLLWTIFGIRTYVPYQTVVVVLHLTVAGLLRAVMRRAGVGPWVATIAASLFALFGSGAQNIVWAFQMGFVASIAFGLTHLLFADHDGPLDQRDWYGIAAGTAGMLCSGLAVPMTVAVGVAVLLRRGWRYALFHTVPLATLYVVWLIAIGHQGLINTAPNSSAVPFARRIVTDTFVALGQVAGVGLLLGVVLAVGTVVAWRDVEARRRLAAPTALLFGAVAFAMITAYGRAVIPIVQSRYLHVTAALVLPAVAVAADALIRRSRAAAPVVLVLLAVGIPGNVAAFYTYRDRERPFLRGFRHTVLATARLPVAQHVRRSTTPFPFEPDLTIGWLVASVPSGRIPDPGPVSPEESARLSQALEHESVHQAPHLLPRPLKSSASSRTDGGRARVVART